MPDTNNPFARNMKRRLNNLRKANGLPSLSRRQNTALTMHLVRLCGDAPTDPDLYVLYRLALRGLFDTETGAGSDLDLRRTPAGAVRVNYGRHFWIDNSMQPIPEQVKPPCVILEKHGAYYALEKTDVARLRLLLDEAEAALTDRETP